MTIPIRVEKIIDKLGTRLSIKLEEKTKFVEIKEELSFDSIKLIELFITQIGKEEEEAEKERIIKIIKGHSFDCNRIATSVGKLLEVIKGSDKNNKLK